MKIKFFPVIILFFIVSSIFAQNNINNYKYVVVPNKFDFLKEKDQYQINSLTKFLFNKYGFEAIMAGSEYPEDLILNRCLGLKPNVIKDSGMFKTKLIIELSNCNDKVIYTSAVGESRAKDYKTAYNLALRDAFKSIKALNYKYVPNNITTSIGTTPQVQVNNETSKEIRNLKKEQVVDVPGVEPKVIAPQPKVVENETLKERSVTKGALNVLYAQAIKNGFQLVDSSPKVVYRIKHTNLKDVFLVEGSSALIYKKMDDWVIEYYSGDFLEQKLLNIKF